MSRNPGLLSLQPHFFSVFFMFPFGFKSESLEENPDHWNEVKRRFDEKDEAWEPVQYEVSEGLEYNEYVYFYPYLRRILFGLEKNYGVLFFRYKKIGESRNWAYYVKASNGKEIALPLRNVFLYLFDPGIGILVFEIYAENSGLDMSQILCFLNNGRRVYIPFIYPLAKRNDDGSFCDAWKRDGSGRSNAVDMGECPEEICGILKHVGVEFRDKKLSWGAKASA